jgi:2-polyprenyl-3-methyl-5-hydroxy-6-metoxy-1,4-benzoquinol methylase
MAFDAKYKDGSWRFEGDATGELPRVVTRYLRRGDLLVVGCGGASILQGLGADHYRSVLGIDVSPEAIDLAGRYASSTVTFQVADVETFNSAARFDEILFSESLYYVAASRQIELLNRLSGLLKPGGTFVVTVADPTRYRRLIERIRAHSVWSRMAVCSTHAGLDCVSA